MRVITLNSNKTVTATKETLDNYILKENEIVSANGETGQVQQADGSFITPTLVPQSKPMTLEEINQNQLTIMNAIADLYAALPTSTTTTT